jgi:TolA-binding protein
MTQEKYYCLVRVLSLIAIALFASGCRSSKEAAVNEGFFEPLTSVSLPAAPKTSRLAEAQKPSQWDQLADTLLKRQKEQERRIGALTGQLQRLGTSGQSNKTDTSRATGTHPQKAPATDVQLSSGKYQEFLRLYEAGQYKAASEGFRGLLQGGVPKEVEDQYHYMLGMSHFKMRQFDQAAASLKTVANWKGSKLRADAYFALGETYKQLGAGRLAKSMFEAALKQSPKADLAQAARKELKELAAKK